MEYISVKEAAEKWGVTPRRVQILCNEKKIKGATRFGRNWMIPSGAVLPSSAKKGEEPHLPMPRKSPFLDMTDLYSEVGRADECAEMLINNPEAYELFKAQIAYRRGEIAQVYKHARYFLDSHSGLYAILGGGMLLASVAIWSGDKNIWFEAKKHICEAPCKTEQEREIISLTLAVIDSTIYDNKDYPEWFKVGNFEKLPAASHPAAKVFYVKYIYMSAFEVALRDNKIPDMQGLTMMKMMPRVIEPLISQAIVDRTIIPEIYLRMSCAVAYYNTGDRERAIAHLDRAISLSLQDKFYGILSEYVRHFGGLLEERIDRIDPEAADIVRDMSTIYSKNWAKLASQIRNKAIASNLTPKEHEIAKLSAFGFSTKDIASLLLVSESTVKQTIVRIINKTGIQEKDEIYSVL